MSMKMKYAVRITIKNYFDTPSLRGQHYDAVDRRPEPSHEMAAINAYVDALPDDEQLQAEEVSWMRDMNDEISGWVFSIFGKQHGTGKHYIAEVVVIKL